MALYDLLLQGGRTYDQMCIRDRLSPRDAATHAYLNLTLTVEEDHAMAFELRLWAAEEHPRVIIRFGVMPRYLSLIHI